jgi:hypothetical protein
MALVQYPQITGDGLGNALRPPLRLGAIAAESRMNRSADKPSNAEPSAGSARMYGIPGTALAAGIVPNG